MPYRDDKYCVYKGDAVGHLGGYGVVFTGPQAKDLQGDYFTPETNLWLEHYPVVPLLYQHGQDDALGKRVIGAATPRRDDVGVWYEAQLSLRDEYETLIDDLVKKGVLGYSTGSLPHLVERAPDGKLLSWPVAEITLTPTPAAGPYLTSVSATRSAYKSAGIDNQAINQIGGNQMAENVLTAEAVDGMIKDAVKSLPVAPDEARVKGLIEEVIKPYLKPESKAGAPAQTAEDKKAAALKAFNVYLTTGDKTKALEEGAAGEGGYLVPEQYYAEVVKGLKDASIIRAAGARVVQMTSDTYVQWADRVLRAVARGRQRDVGRCLQAAGDARTWIADSQEQ